MLWALADEGRRSAIRDAHAEAVDEVVRYYEDRAVFARAGGGDRRLTASDGIVAAAFDHRTSRAGDPLHKKAALGCMKSFGTTDFRHDLPNVTLPTLVIHGDGDETVPFAGSGKRTHEAIAQSELVVLSGAPHGCNVSHADEFNRALLEFLARST